MKIQKVVCVWERKGLEILKQKKQIVILKH